MFFNNLREAALSLASMFGFKSLIVAGRREIFDMVSAIKMEIRNVRLPAIKEEFEMVPGRKDIDWDKLDSIRRDANISTFLSNFYSYDVNFPLSASQKKVIRKYVEWVLVAAGKYDDQLFEQYREGKTRLMDALDEKGVSFDEELLEELMTQNIGVYYDAGNSKGAATFVNGYEIIDTALWKDYSISDPEFEYGHSGDPSVGLGPEDPGFGVDITFNVDIPKSIMKELSNGFNYIYTKTCLLPENIAKTICESIKADEREIENFISKNLDFGIQKNSKVYIECSAKKKSENENSITFEVVVGVSGTPTANYDEDTGNYFYGSKELKFSSAEEAIQKLANLTGNRIIIANNDLFTKFEKVMYDAWKSLPKSDILIEASGFENDPGVGLYRSDNPTIEMEIDLTVEIPKEIMVEDNDGIYGDDFLPENMENTINYWISGNYETPTYNEFFKEYLNEIREVASPDRLYSENVDVKKLSENDDFVKYEVSFSVTYVVDMDPDI